MMMISSGTYRGRAWIPSCPPLGWVVGLIWRGKVFDGTAVINRLCWVRGVPGQVIYHDAYFVEVHYCQGRIVDFIYPAQRPGVYMGWSRIVGLDVYFILTKVED